jgi:hypothetical protein
VLQELTAQSGAQAWAIASMVFFMAVFAVIAVRAWRARPEVVARCAHLPLVDDGMQSAAAGAHTEGAKAPGMN